MKREFQLGNLGRLGAMCSLAAAIFAGNITGAEAKPSGELFDSVNVTGVATDIETGTTSTLEATLDINRVQLDGSGDGSISIQGTITGDVIDADGITTDILGQIITTTGTLIGGGDNNKKCDFVSLDFGGVELDLLGLSLDVSEVEFDVSGTRGNARWLANQLCKITRFIDKGDLSQVEKTLDRINSIIGSPLTNIPVGGEVDGDLETSATFSGFITIEGLSVEGSGEVSVSGIVNGVITDDEFTTVVANQTFSTTATVSGSSVSGKKCDTVILELGVVELEPEGIAVDLGEVAVDTSNFIGSTKKLTKSLCKVVKVLDQADSGKFDNKPEKLAKKLEKAARKVNDLLLN